MDFDLALLRELGGWAVVLIIVRWMMTRIDAQIASSDRQIMAMLHEFKEWRDQDALQHRNLEEGLHTILKAINPK